MWRQILYGGDRPYWILGVQLCVPVHYSLVVHINPQGTYWDAKAFCSRFSLAVISDFLSEIT